MNRLKIEMAIKELISIRDTIGSLSTFPPGDILKEEVESLLVEYRHSASKLIKAVAELKRIRERCNKNAKNELYKEF